MKKPKRIVLITPGQPSSNPRLLKEAVAFSEGGYRVTVLYNFWVSWASEQDEKIKGAFPQIQWIETGGNPQSSSVLYFYTRLRHKIFRCLHQLFPQQLKIMERAEGRGYQDLLKKAKKIKADLYLAHNLAALPVAARAAKKNKAKYAFDAEDFHRGQVTTSSPCYKRITKLEETWLPNADYLSAASPLIAAAYTKTIGREVTVINNVFPKTFICTEEVIAKTPIKLFWFSQTIGKKRGLEDIFQALKVLPIENFSLTLLGSCTEDTKKYFTALTEKDDQTSIQVRFLPPVHPDEIFSIAAQHDIGLALEPGRDANNQYALSNKIFTYLTAGNAVVFSSTPAQQAFYEENPGIGSLYNCGKPEELAAVLMEYIKNPSFLRSQKHAAKKLAQEKYNWDKEKNKLLRLVADII